ncbi:hypothetical protein EUX98_g2019 [Antrodiella citrinella]|uniref:Rab proteins geranylgeranyltransferase component A n=1 Tax=Antrodiella citrinella TaxID=2447956 RepID=A0A4S4N022_9APHY|nr:hypothetical protein EUX98_g2019 [Antrodiella citrinella]
MDVDVVVLGTGLRESVLAAALSKAGCTVAHLDHNAYYGGDDASLSLDELRQWADERTVSTHTSTYLTSQHARCTSISSSSPSPPPKSRQFSISLSPTIIPSVGPLVDALVASGASRYGGFKLLERVALYDKPGFVKTVPGSKEDVFKSADLSLLEKRRLMRFLMFSASEFEAKPELEGKEDAPFLEFLRQTFSLNESTSEAVAYALAFCACAADPTLPALQRIRTYLRSAGRYGASPFLIGHYGGVGEVAQGFCRISAVQGGIYILGREVSSIDRPDAAASGESSSRQFSVSLKNFEEQLHCDLLVSTDDYLDTGLLSRATRIAEAEAETQSTARCMAIIDHRIAFRNERDSATAANPADAENPQEEDRSDQVDTALLIFPPSRTIFGCSQEPL